MELTQMSRDELEALAGQIRTRIAAMDRLDEARDTAVAAVAAYATAAGVTVEQAWRDLAPQAVTTTPDAPAFVQPTGAHDVYAKGAVVTFEGQVYRSTRDNTAWSPSAYPQGWEAIA